MRWYAFALALAALIVLVPRPVAATWSDVCGMLARSVERTHGIPQGLVQAVALAESGRWIGAGRGSRSWPWTVTSGADSFYLPSKQAAVLKVEELRAAGRTNIDVGCMQVNLHYHGRHFASIDEALDPAANVQYGARFLRSLRTETRSWGRATAHYHSRTASRGEAYRAKVYKLWNQVRRQPSRRLAPQQLALDGVAREAEPLIEPETEVAEPAAPTRLKRPLIGGSSGTRAAGGLLIIRGN
jgi:hypothetical protein